MALDFHTRGALDCAACSSALAECVELARSTGDSTVVHELRVACARLEVFLRLAGWRVLRPDLRWLRRAASAVRDLDVLLAGAPPPRVRAALQRERRHAHAAWLDALGSERTAALLVALEAAPRLDSARALAACSRLRRRVERRGRAVERGGGDVRRLHALRRALRRLRYAREWLELDCTPIRELQDVLGALNDAVVEQGWLAKLAPRLRDAQRARVARKLRIRRTAALEAWRAARGRILERPA